MLVLPSPILSHSFILQARVFMSVWSQWSVLAFLLPSSRKGNLTTVMSLTKNPRHDKTIIIIPADILWRLMQSHVAYSHVPPICCSDEGLDADLVVAYEEDNLDLERCNSRLQRLKALRNSLVTLLSAETTSNACSIGHVDSRLWKRMVIKTCMCQIYWSFFDVKYVSLASITSPRRNFPKQTSYMWYTGLNDNEAKAVWRWKQEEDPLGFMVVTISLAIGSQNLDSQYSWQFWLSALPRPWLPTKGFLWCADGCLANRSDQPQD